MNLIVQTFVITFMRSSIPIDIAGHIAHRTRGVVALGHAQIYVVEYILGIGRAPDMVAHIAEKLLLVRFHIIGQLSYEFVPVHAV